MKLLKAGIVVCIATLLVGIVGTGATLGNLCKTSQLVHEIKLEEELTIGALKNIYISSDVPLRIVPTTGTAKVVFESSLTGIAITEPQYAIDVNVQGDTSYIDIRNKSTGMVGFFFDNLNAEAVLYLPEQAMDTLKIDLRRSDYLRYQGKVDIKELVVDGGNVSIDLEGNISKVKVDGHQVNMTLNTHIPADVQVNGRAQSSKVVLGGKYNKIQIDDIRYGSILVDSETPYEIKGNNSSLDMVLQGAVNSVEMNVGSGNITVDTTIEPKLLNIEGYNGEVKIYLPEVAKGFGGIWEYADYGDEPELYTNLDITKRQVGESSRHLQYGEGGTRLMLNLSDTRLYIMK